MFYQQYLNDKNSIIIVKNLTVDDKMVNVSLPVVMEKEMEALIRSGYYSSKSDVVKDALRFLLENKTNLKIAAAIEMYRRDEISLGRAAEISGLSIEEFKDVLKSRGIRIVVKAPSRRDMDREMELMKH